MLGTLTLAALVALAPTPDVRCTEAVAALDDSGARGRFGGCVDLWLNPTFAGAPRR